MKEALNKKKRIAKYILPANANELITIAYQQKVGMESCSKKKHPVRDLAQKFGVPRWKITRRATYLGLHSKKKKEPCWTDPEIRILKRHARFSPETIQRKLRENGYRRSLMGVVLKRKRMRFIQNLNGSSANTLALCFGVDTKAIVRWIEKGYLKAERRKTARTEKQGGDVYFIKYVWIRNFIINSVCVIDFRKIDKYWLVDLLAGGQIGTGPANGLQA
ncbi:hypothetical protein KAR91_74995 [Candidatus Pacearchaeota archaeon]|nr:hypothetical protein [Candidatus Pacearchaeota archaeon]